MPEKVLKLDCALDKDGVFSHQFGWVGTRFKNSVVI